MFKSHMRDITEYKSIPPRTQRIQHEDKLVEIRLTKLNVSSAMHTLLKSIYREKLKLKTGFLKSPEESYGKLAMDAYYLELKKLTTLQDEIQIAYREYSV